MLSAQSIAQRSGEIRGVVTDSNGTPLQNATVSVFSDQDSTAIAYTLTSERGKFLLAKLPVQKKQSIYITHVNGAAFSQQIDFTNGDIVNLDTIKLGSISLEEVVVERQVPIRLHGDTLEYKASYFKTRPNANVEELLKLLPGLQVNLDGSILFEGKEVSTIRINNKDFFSNDIKIATKNLDASLIDVVQVIRDKGDSKRMVLNNSDLPVVINLKMKREFFKANFGKLYGGIATRDRYESGALLNTFRDTLQVSFIGFANNISRAGFDNSELSEHGGLGRAENSSYTNYGNSGLLNQLSAGVNINYDLEERLKTNVMYNYNQRNYTNVSTNRSNSFYDEVTESSAVDSKAENDNFEHNVRAFFRYRIDTTSSVAYDARVDQRRDQASRSNISHTIRNTEMPVEDSDMLMVNSDNMWNFNHRLNYEKKFNNTWLFSLNHVLRQGMHRATSRNESLTRYYLFNDSLIDQQVMTDRASGSLSLDNSANLQIPLSVKGNLDVFAQHIFGREYEQQDLITRINAPIFINRNDIANDKAFSAHHLAAGIRWNQRLRNVVTTAGLKWLELNSTLGYYGKRDNFDRRQGYLLPEVSFNFKGLNLQYRRDVTLPPFSNVVAVHSDLYPTHINLATPNFENTIEDAMDLQYHKFFQKSNLNVFAYARFIWRDNSIGNFSTYNVENSFSTSGYYQAGRTYERSFHVDLRKTFIENEDWGISYSVNYFNVISNDYLWVNEEENMSDRNWGQWKNSLSIRYKMLFRLEPSYQLNLSSTTYNYTSENFRNVVNNEHNFGASILMDNLHKFRLESSYTLRNQVSNVAGDRQNLHLINASLYYPVFGKGELKFSIFDLLNQNISNYFTAYNTTNLHISTVTLRQYFLLGFVYKFLKAPAK